MLIQLAVYLLFQFRPLILSVGELPTTILAGLTALQVAHS